MARELNADLSGRGLRIGIVASRFNEFITARLLQGARDALLQPGVREEHITIAWVPGALELAQAAQQMVRSGHLDALVALGAVIRGETFHFELVAIESARGVGEVARQTGIPIAFGVLTTDTVEQATERAGGRLGNKGADAAAAAIQMANLFSRLNADPPASTADHKQEKTRT
jgi:6,7-dimethyl-8-ribityllumazine synthase